ncbi:MAG: response regulator [Oligoflexia bacterium]|nr:response regulator [Oligoflexia bacterium]
MRKYKVVIVEDQNEMLNHYKDVFENMNITGFNKGSKAFDFLISESKSSRKPDAVIFDHELMDDEIKGLQFAMELKSKYLPTTPFFLISGETTKDIRDLARKNGITPLTKTNIEEESDIIIQLIEDSIKQNKSQKLDNYYIAELGEYYLKDDLILYTSENEIKLTASAYGLLRELMTKAGTEVSSIDLLMTFEPDTEFDSAARNRLASRLLGLRKVLKGTSLKIDFKKGKDASESTYTLVLEE